MNTLILIFYRIAAFFTRVPRKTKEYNLKKNSDSPEVSKIKLLGAGDFIESQEHFEDIRFGSCALNRNGCGPIATFNALKSLGVNPDENDFFRILRTYEKKGAALRAAFGTSPLSIRKFFDDWGFKTSAVASDSKQKLNALSNEFDTFITIIENNAKSIKAGLHYICITKNADGKFVSHNPSHVADSIYEVMSMCSATDIKPVYTIGIRKRT